MPCNDISEEYMLDLNKDEIFSQLLGYKKTCGKQLKMKSESKKFVGKQIMDILECPFDQSADIFKRKFLIAVKSILCEYIGFDSPFIGCSTTIQGIEQKPDSSISIIAGIHLSIPIDDIKPCKNACGNCSQ